VTFKANSDDFYIQLLTKLSRHMALITVSTDKNSYKQFVAAKTGNSSGSFVV